MLYVTLIRVGNLFFILFVLFYFIFAVFFFPTGVNLWIISSNAENAFESILPSADFDRFMKHYRFKHFRKFIVHIWKDASGKASNE